MERVALIVITFVTSFIGVAIIHPYLVKFAKAKNIVDNPNTRKLQLRPVPVLGGLAIFFGIVAGLLAAHTVIDSSELFVIISAMMIMTYVGALDDVLDISPIIRLISQIITVLILIYIGGLSLNNFHGLWGINSLSAWVYVPLTPDCFVHLRATLFEVNVPFFKPVTCLVLVAPTYCLLIGLFISLFPTFLYAITERLYVFAVGRFLIV